MGVEVFFALVLTSQYRHVDILIMKNLFQGRIDLFKVIFFVVSDHIDQVSACIC